MALTAVIRRNYLLREDEPLWRLRLLLTSIFTVFGDRIVASILQLVGSSATELGVTLVAPQSGRILRK
jgi:hypothetical protein